MRRFLLLFSLTLSFVAPAFAKTGDVTDFMLGNGMQVVVIEDHRAPVVTHMVWYKVGSADEPPGKTGIAHFLEHLMFKGTDTLEPGEFNEIISRNGGNDNAFTSYDYTGYFQRVAADRLDLMMSLEADRMQNLVLTEEEVATERLVVLEERKTRIDNNPSGLFFEARRGAFYSNHPYRNPIVGWQDEIEGLTMQDALDFYALHYAPNNAILVVAGDTTPGAVRALAEKHYGVIPANPAIQDRVRPQEPKHRAAIRLVFTDPRIRQPSLIRGYAAPQRKTGDQREAAALVLLAQLLGGSGISSVMGQELQLGAKLAVYTTAWHNPLSYDRSDFGLYAVPAPGVALRDLENGVDDVIALFLETGVDLDHLARLKTQVAAQQIYSMDSQDQVARRYGMALTSGLTVADVQAWPDVLQSITAEEIMDAARKVFDVKQSITGWELPEGMTGEATQ